MEPIEIYDSINNKHINVYVTTEVAEKCRTDNGFAQDLFNKLQDQNIEDGSAIEIETIKCEINEDEEPFLEEVVDKGIDKEIWSRRETLKLLKAYQTHQTKFNRLPQKKVVWTIIANELAELGIYKSADKCAEKWHNLRRTYKAINDKPSTPTRFQFLEEMQNIFNNTEMILSDSDPDEVELKYNPNSKPSPITSEESIEKESWSKYETLKLLKYFQKHNGLKHNFPSDKQLWAAVASDLANDNIQKLPDKCATKWKNLYRSYKRNIEKPSLPLRFQYFHEVADVVNNIELQMPNGFVNISDDMDFEKILDPDQFKCFLEKADFHVKSKEVATWSQNETMKLIQAYKKHKNKFKMCPSKKYVWAIIVSELAKEGIHRDIEKCENKWKSLLRSYRRGVDSGEYPRFYFYEEIAECLNDNIVNDREVSTTQNDNFTTYETIDPENDDPDSMDNADGSENEAHDNAVNKDGNAAFEHIIIETEPELPDPTEPDDNQYWSYNEICALIKAYASHRNNFTDVKKKSQTWKEVAGELASYNIQKSPESCEKKWRGLYNIYRTHKINKSGPGKFRFYKEIDDVLKEKLDVTSETGENTIHNNKCKCMKNRMLEKQQRHIERMQLLKRKLDLEERKVEAFEYYVKHLKTTSIS